MANFESLHIGDPVLWNVGKEAVLATIVRKTEAGFVAIKVQREGKEYLRYVGPKSLRAFGNHKRSAEKRAENELQEAMEFVRAYNVGPQRLREVFDREKEAGRINWDFGQMELRLEAYRERLGSHLEGIN